MTQHNFNAKTVSILIIAFFVRLLGITSRPIWYDEAFSILFAQKGISAMLYGTVTAFGGRAAEEHPLGYYALLGLWMKALGASPVAARLLSVLAGTISIYLIYLIAKEILANEKAAQLAMLFAALAPFQVHYAQEIRMYSFLEMWLLLATVAYQRGVRTHRWKWWLLFAISAAFAQYTHNLAVFFLAALALVPLLQRDWRGFRALTISGVAAIVLYLPWLMQLPAQFAKIQGGYWIDRPPLSRLLTLLIVYVANTPLPRIGILVALVIALSAVIIGLLQTVRHVSETNTFAGLWLFHLSFFPPLLLFLFSQWRPVYVERALLPSGGIFCIWLAWVLTCTTVPPIIRNLLLASLFVTSTMGIYAHLTYKEFPYGSFQALDSSLQERLGPHDLIVHSNKLTFLPSLLYNRHLPQTFIADPPGSNIDTLSPATQKTLGIEAHANIQSATKGVERVWYIIYQQSIDEFVARGKDTYPDLDYLTSNYTLASQETWDSIQVYLFTSEQ